MYKKQIKMSKNKEIQFDFCPLSSYTFQIHLEKLWNIIKDTTRLSELISKIHPKWHTEPITISNSLFYEESNQFKIKLNHVFDLFVTIDEIVESDYYCKIKWKISYPDIFRVMMMNGNKELIDNNQFERKNDVTFVINLHKISDKQTYFVSEFDDIKDLMKMHQQIMKLSSNSENKIQLYYKVIDKCIQKTYMFNSQTESRIISATFAMAKNYFINARVCTGMMGKIISFTDEIVKKGTIVVYKNTQNVTCIIQVKHCSIRKNKVNLIFSIFEGSNPYPTRELKVELFNVNRGETFVVLTHNFLSEVTNEEITNLSFGKRKLLKKLGSIIEKSFKLESQSVNGIE